MLKTMKQIRFKFEPKQEDSVLAVGLEFHRIITEKSINLASLMTRVFHRNYMKRVLRLPLGEAKAESPLPKRISDENQ